MTRSGYRLSLGLIILLAAAAQFGLFDLGLYRITSDESARILTAWGMTRSNALEPFLWPPFYKLFVGSAMRIFPDIFLTPRILVGVTGLVCLASLTWLATALFQDRKVSLVAAILAVLAPQRLIFSVVPLSDIYYFLFVISAAACAASWLRSNRSRFLLLACLFILLAETVRFESGLFAAFLEVLLLYRVGIARDLRIATFLGASVLLFVFPALWALNSFVWYGSLSNLGVVTQQFVGMFGHDYIQALKWAPLRWFIQDTLWNPLTIAGILVVLILSVRQRAMLLWSMVFLLPLLVFSVTTVVSLSTPTAATWRTSGVWTLMMLPFDAVAACWIGGILAQSFRVPRVALAGLLILAILPNAVRSLWYTRDGLFNNETHLAHQERQLDRYVDKKLSHTRAGEALIDSSTNLDYLDVLAFARHPDRLLLTGGGDPIRIGFYEPMRTAYAGRPEADFYLKDRFGLAHGGDLRALNAHHVSLIVVRNPAFIAALDTSPLATRLRSFNDWTVYGLSPTVSNEPWHGAVLKTAPQVSPAG
ncbi:hypothetical protein [Lichenicoccus roseus]|uniref:Glycosyltransferase RgtA/B/C/D-like domain-containing protein n=1 Tax=Lichenicoccus roseus TaxID=2683649 RepID=A0A5R9JG71_9PROT|nr:hypothetical protein [Lichenicoccus roseus]TLU74416.1 hypothetical protein FE263_04320 [Lichenicoccus roseus]